MSRSNHGHRLGGPPKFFIRKHNRMEKSRFKKEMNRWKNNNDYPIAIELRTPNSAKWCWF